MCRMFKAFYFLIIVQFFSHNYFFSLYISRILNTWHFSLVCVGVEGLFFQQLVLKPKAHLEESGLRVSGKSGGEAHGCRAEKERRGRWGDFMLMKAASLR